jgi:SAM-dependent methyltransferase
MNRRYVEDLRLLKSTFDNGNEANIIAQAIADNSPKTSLRILDVGIGEGRAVFQVVDKLNTLGFKAELTGVDLHISPELRALAPVNSTLVEQDFIAYPAHEQFDAVIATQSLYYFGERSATLGKLLEHTCPTGTLIVTVWSSRCILHNLHMHLSDTPDAKCISSEDVVDELRLLNTAAHIDHVRSAGTVDLERWVANDAICMAAFRILSRANPHGSFDDAKYRAFSQYLKALPGQMKRENGTVIIRRSSIGSGE